MNPVVQRYESIRVEDEQLSVMIALEKVMHVNMNGMNSELTSKQIREIAEWFYSKYGKNE